MKNNAGFTLLELLTAVAVASIVVVLSTSFSGVVKNNLVTSTVQDFVGAVNLARNEAITRGQRVTVCKSDPAIEPRACINDAGATSWDLGWIVFVDEGNNQVVVNPNQNIIRVYGGLGPNLSLAADITVEDYISFIKNGFPKKADNSFLNPENNLTLCDDQRINNVARQIVILRSGHVKTEAIASNNANCGA